ncbi:MAG: type I DNA topoisomerase [Escherichia coli]|nr:type I DNA topoisomerase [Escherichia coli]
MAKSALFTVRNNESCPKCGAELVIRSGKHGPFLGCSQYPACDYVRPLKSSADGHIVLIDKPDETAITCPQCRTGHLVQRRSRYGKTFHSCDRYPECQFAINFKPIAGECPECHYPLLIEKKTAQGVKHFCASKQCGKPISAE